MCAVLGDMYLRIRWMACPHSYQSNLINAMIIDILHFLVFLSPSCQVYENCFLHLLGLFDKCSGPVWVVLRIHDWFHVCANPLGPLRWEIIRVGDNSLFKYYKIICKYCVIFKTKYLIYFQRLEINTLILLLYLNLVFKYRNLGFIVT